MGRHTIRLTAVSPRMGDATRDVIIDVSPADTTPPDGSPSMVDPFPVAHTTFRATADDPESGITRVELYGRFHGACLPPGVYDPAGPPDQGGVPVNLDFETTPFAVGTGGQLVPDGGTGVTFTAGLDLCTGGLDYVPPMRIEVWAVVTNGAGLSFRTGLFMLMT